MNVFDVDSSPYNGSSIWIDLDNTPHAPFFKPIISELESRGHQILLTVRRITQLTEIADQYGFQYTKLGKHGGKSKISKVVSLLNRSYNCYRYLGKRRPDLAISHGARSQILTANILGIPTIEFIDYEHVVTPPGCCPKWEFAPECYPSSTSRVPLERFKTYPGIKEDVYTSSFKPSNRFLEKLMIDRTKTIITIRPPATEAHYHNEKSDYIFNALLSHIGLAPNLHAFILPRNQRQRQLIEYLISSNAKNDLSTYEPSNKNGYHDYWNSFTIPSKALNALDLIWESDLVIGGGGTLTREAAALNIPSYSFFCGTLGSVDAQLVKENRLTFIESHNDIKSKIRFVKRDEKRLSPKNPNSLRAIVQNIESILRHNPQPTSHN